MQISLTKKFAKALKTKLPKHREQNSLFSWSANWIKVWSDSKTHDGIILVNNATRFIVAIYEIKRININHLSEILKKAIYNTLLDLDFNVEMIDEYMSLAGDIELVDNPNRQFSAWLVRAGQDFCHYIKDDFFNDSKMYSDTLGTVMNYLLVSSKNEDYFMPYEKMEVELSKITGKQSYKYRALELDITLDLEKYKAKRKIIVPADMGFEKFHKVLQKIFDWENCHLYSFLVLDKDKKSPITELFPAWDECKQDSVLMKEHILSDFFPKYNNMLYIYDPGDNWVHNINLVRVIEDYNKKPPYLQEAIGKTPPEDVGGVSGYLHFLEVINNTKHSEYKEFKKWIGYWEFELSDYEKKPKTIIYY